MVNNNMLLYYGSTCYLLSHTPPAAKGNVRGARVIGDLYMYYIYSTLLYMIIYCYNMSYIRLLLGHSTSRLPDES